jgi:hypothetical protein
MIVWLLTRWGATAIPAVLIFALRESAHATIEQRLTPPQTKEIADAVNSLLHHPVQCSKGPDAFATGQGALTPPR